MAVTNSLRGNGLSGVQGALYKLEVDTLELDRARMRFSQPPPSYKSNPSGTTTRSASPEPPSDEQRSREQQEERFQRQRKLVDERAASLPLQQFKAQRNEERGRIWNADPRTNWMSESKIPIGGTEEKQAIEAVQKCWKEQGIWKDTWDEMAAGRYVNVGRWKHEESLQLESESETDTDAKFPPPSFNIFGLPQRHSQPKPRRPKSNDEKQRIAERRAVQEREREASRPYHQFIYQISKERERNQDESGNGEGADAADINSRAYENVKNTWIKRGIWNATWGILPGMSWKHEEPLEEEAADDPVSVPANPLANGSYDAGEAPTRHIFGSPSPVSSDHSQTTGIISTSQQGPPADVDLSSITNMSRPRRGARVLHPTTGQALGPSRKQSSHKYGQPQPVASASLGPVHSSKVSKATGRRKPRPQRRPNAAQTVSSSGPPLLYGPDIAEPLVPTTSITPRRSKRLEMPEHSTAKVPTGITCTDSLQVLAQSWPKRNGVEKAKSKGSAQTRGISKKTHSSRTRGKARRDDN